MRLGKPGLTPEEAVVLLAEGNPGAAKAVGQVCRASGSYGPLNILDILGIYGSDIWVLYKDVCKENPVNMSILLLAHAAKVFEDDYVKNLIAGKDEPPTDYQAVKKLAADNLMKGVTLQ